MVDSSRCRNPGFLGIAFRARPDARHYEMFYLRPGNSRAADQAMRNHAVPYVESPGFDWYKLRRASLFLDGASNPALVVGGLKGEDLKGGVGLWGSPDQESYFSNLRITHAKPQPVENGGDAAARGKSNTRPMPAPLPA